MSILRFEKAGLAWNVYRGKKRLGRISKTSFRPSSGVTLSACELASIAACFHR
jgi:hypothetical protein